MLRLFLQTAIDNKLHFAHSGVKDCDWSASPSFIQRKQGVKSQRKYV